MPQQIEIIGWAGTLLVLVAYIPQIHHLYVEKCAWGISVTTWLMWLVAGALLLTYCIVRNDTLFVFVQSINIAAIVTTILLARRSDRICPYHLNTAVMRIQIGGEPEARDNATSRPTIGERRSLV